MKESKVTRKGAARVRKPEPPPKKGPPPRSPDQEKTVEEYAAALKNLQKRDYARARDQFKALIEKHPDEKEICERARTYIQICERALQPPSPRLRDANDYYQQGIFLLNRRDLDEAGRMFEKALSLEPENEKTLYAQAACLALAGRRDEAVGSLKRAIALNLSNRAIAARDADFDGLRDHEEFVRLVSRGKETAE